MKQTITYLNLTNGIEALEYFPNARWCRIQSSHVESKAFNTMLMQLSDDLLLNLAKGNKVVIIDGGVNQKFPKSMRNGIGYITAVLEWYWFNTPIDEVFYQKCIKKINENVKRKMKYYKKFLDTDKLFILPLSFETKCDGNYKAYADMLNNNGEN